MKTETKKNLNEAGYGAAPVAYGWAGAVFEVTKTFDQEQSGQMGINMRQESITHQPTDGQSGV